MTTNRAPRFYGYKLYILKNTNGSLYLQSLGMDIWKSIENGYTFLKETSVVPKEIDKNEHTIPRTSLVEPKDRTSYQWNSKDKNEIIYGLEYDEFTKVIQCTTTKYD